MENLKLETEIKDEGPERFDNFNTVIDDIVGYTPMENNMRSLAKTTQVEVSNLLKSQGVIFKRIGEIHTTLNSLEEGLYELKQMMLVKGSDPIPETSSIRSIHSSKKSAPLKTSVFRKEETPSNFFFLIKSTS